MAIILQLLKYFFYISYKLLLKTRNKALEKKLLEIKENINNSPDGYKLRIKVVANSKKDSIECLKNYDNEEILKLKIAKPAIDGKANKAIVEYISNLFDVPKSNISFLNGEKSSQKVLIIKPKRHII